MPINCKQCGGPHLTMKCLAARAAQQPQGSRSKTNPVKRPRFQKDWMLPQHERLLDLLQTPGTLAGEERDFVLAGVSNGPYKDKQIVHGHARVVVGPDYKLFIDGSLIHHGSLWTTKDSASRHNEHITNCVKDSRAWQIRRVTTSKSIPELVDAIIAKFGEVNMYYRKHADGRKSVKVFDKGLRSCQHCRHCDAYDYLNELLDCSAFHGPRTGWEVPNVEPEHEGSARTESTAQAMQKHEGDGSSSPGSLHPNCFHRIPSKMDCPQNVPTSWEQLLPQDEILMLRFKNHADLYDALFASDLGQRLISQGISIKPDWARGATVLFPTKPAALPEDTVASLRPYHVLVKKDDLSVVERALETLSYKGRPRRKIADDVSLSLQFAIVNTFIHVAEPRDESASSTWTKSTSDARAGYTNPRTNTLDFNSWTDAVSSAAVSAAIESERVILAKMKTFQERRDLPSAIQCYSQMLSNEIQPDVQVFTIIIDICAKNCNCEEAERWMMTMKDNNIEPNLLSFNCIIRAYAQWGDVSKVATWYESMLAANIQPSVVTYNCLITAYTQRGCMNEAMEWLKTAEAEVELNKHSFAPFIEYFARRGLSRKAEDWFKRMGDYGIAHDSETYGMMMAAAAKTRDLEGARLWSERMQEAGHPLGVYEYTQLLRACAPCDVTPERKLYWEATAIFHDQIRFHITPNRFNLSALEGAVGCERALDLCKELHVDVEAAEREATMMRDEFGLDSWMARKIDENGALQRNTFHACDYGEDP